MTHEPPNMIDPRVADAAIASTRRELARLAPHEANVRVAFWLRAYLQIAVERLGRDEAGAILRGAAADAGARLILPPPRLSWRRVRSIALEKWIGSLIGFLLAIAVVMAARAIALGGI